ncbi:hypothetical protein [Pseudomonas sp. Pseusp97]|uniref:hypothetical protein n=1 Tax=Pseudomonas sp. Pseusp97 TaxID=3243065 RepID=UPI0039A69763
MSALTLEGWCKLTADQKPIPVTDIHFYLTDDDRLHLEQAELYLQENDRKEMMVDTNLDTLDLHMPDSVGPLADCMFRVYLGGAEHRGQFHLVGHRASDGCLFYTNAVLIDQLIN